MTDTELTVCLACAAYVYQLVLMSSSVPVSVMSHFGGS